MGWDEAYSRYELAKEFGFEHRGLPSPSPYLDVESAHGVRYLDANPAYPSPYTAKDGSHDDGALAGPYLGGIGTANFSRDLAGYFSGWQLQQGVHQHEAIEPAFFMLRWSTSGAQGFRGYRRLQLGEKGFSGADYRYAALFPLVYEFYSGPDLPFELLLEYYSPTIPHNYIDSCLPLSCFNFYVRSRCGEALELSIGLSWPNMLGWRLPFLATELRRSRQWPSQQNAGNSAALAQKRGGRCHLAQTRVSAVPRDEDLTGAVFLSVDGGEGWETSYKACYRACQISTGLADEDQAYTLAHMEAGFRRDGRLDNDGVSWTARWHEPLASALAATARLEPGGRSEVLFAITMDMPITSFGMGRNWRKAYTERWGCACDRSLELAEYGLDSNRAWLKAIDEWHTAELAASAGLPNSLRGARINELFFVASGGSAWLSGPAPGQERGTASLGSGRRFGLLEGFDTGYYYYNTLDLWVYAFAGLSKNWPELAECVFADFLASAAMRDGRRHLVYRQGALADNLLYGKLPHDMGSPAEDPWAILNGYVHRDDPNVWKDHNPAFITAFFLHRAIVGNMVSEAEYRSLKIIADFTIAQDLEGLGVPKHGDFGDSTWDNLDMRGLSSYASGLCIGAWAVMAALAERFEPGAAEEYRDLLVKAQASLDTLWNGRYFKTNDGGKYGEAAMTDSLLGVFLARKAGLGDLVTPDRVRAHLVSIYQYNFKEFADGAVGPLLVAEPARKRFDKDGGEELQVNEVLVGSAWAFAAMLEEYGLRAEADELCAVLAKMLYGGSGLQFRSPAAWNASGRFRAAPGGEDRRSMYSSGTIPYPKALHRHAAGVRPRPPTSRSISKCSSHPRF
jgi:non-lysosomal glucosylceramidase